MRCWGDLELARLEFSRAHSLMQRGAGTIEARDQASATLKKAGAALERDQAVTQAMTACGLTARAAETM